MQTGLLVVYWLNIISFFAYGTSCLLSSHMVREFKRYQVPQLRIATGVLQIFASIGLILGSSAPALGISAAFCLAFMMGVAILVRFRIKDPFLNMSPALIYLGINLLIMGHFLKSF